MLAIQKKRESPKVEAHALPCRLHHSGHIDTRNRWKPESQVDGTSTVYFRGRKLRGRTIKLPEGYEGHILKTTETRLPQNEPLPQIPPEDANGDDDEGEEDTLVDVKVVEDIGTFEHITVWGHDAVPGEEEDPYARGIKEWIGLAEAIHGSPTERHNTDTGQKV
ncbi:ribonuclease H1 small subunit [Rhizodiscina lignyota]|uniref:Ribonuclease H1 small subunit n=1 Tax=Rhizodiscina lignyota TaxID=1504668 RepID=A0A9P4IKT8_9PEZI|nr:ribonuclease H1 small subunit [Rhizodiscina lignyota]